MKTKIFAILCLCLLVSFFCVGYNTSFSRFIQPYYLTTPKVNWTSLGSISASQALPDGTARSYSDINGLAGTKVISWDLNQQDNGGMIRVQTSADGDVDQLDMWVLPSSTYADGTTEDSFLYGGRISVTGGTQTAPNSNVFVSTMTFTAGVLNGVVWGSGGNSLCPVLKFDAEGYKAIRFTCPVLESGATVYVDGRTY